MFKEAEVNLRPINRKENIINNGTWCVMLASTRRGFFFFTLFEDKNSALPVTYNHAHK